MSNQYKPDNKAQGGGWDPMPGTPSLTDTGGVKEKEPNMWQKAYEGQYGVYDANTNPGTPSVYKSNYQPVQTDSGAWSRSGWSQQNPPRSDAGQASGFQPTQNPYSAEAYGAVYNPNSNPGVNFQLPEGFGNSMGFWAGPDRAAAMNAYASTLVPLQQLQQNAYQYGMDFNEAQRRDDRNFNWQQFTDRAGIDMGWADRAMAQQAQNIASDQWNQQFGFETDMANRQFGLEDYATRAGVQQEWDKIRNQYAIEQRAMDIDQAYRNGMLSIEQRNMALQELENQQKYGLAQQEFGLSQQKFGLSQQELALQAQLGLGGLNLDREQLAQAWQKAMLDAQLQREGYQNQQAIAAMNNFGRSQAPTSRWIRNY